MGKSKRLSKNKRQKKRRTHKINREAKKYIDLMNLALSNMNGNFTYEFTNEDYVLYPYLNEGFKKGWKVLKSKDMVKELSCNSLCMTISILNSSIAEKEFDKLNPLEKMYLFFISYMLEDDKEGDMRFALKKADRRILIEKKRYEKYEQENNARGMKKSLKYINDMEQKKKQIIDSNGMNKLGVGSLFGIDVCNNVDCEFLHEYKMSKGEKWSSSYSKLCLNITDIFKGIVWLIMCLSYGNYRSPHNIPKSKRELSINLDIRKIIKKADILLIPTMKMYDNELFYENNTLDRKRKENISKGEYWVYKDLDIKNKKIYKRSIRHLENKHYVVAFMDLYIDWKLPKETKEKIEYENFKEFLNGTGKKPMLKEIYKQKKNIGGDERNNLSENIENSITNHWLYVHRDRIYDMIEKWV